MGVDFSGMWHNQHDSEMELSVDTDGDVVGTYQSDVGAPEPTEKFDLKGFASGDLIVFCVNFGKYGSLTSWSGQVAVESGKEILHTSWLLAKDIEETEEPEWLWSGMRTGCDRFWRGPSPKRR